MTSAPSNSPDSIGDMLKAYGLRVEKTDNTRANLGKSTNLCLQEIFDTMTTSEPTAITVERIELERLAISLFYDAILQERQQAKPKDRKPTPRWVDLGLQIRTAYRAAAYQLLEEN